MIKKHNWMKYGRSGEIVEIKIKTFEGKDLDFFRCNNPEDFNQIMGILQRKYGYGQEKRNEEEINREVQEEIEFLNKTREKKWLNKDMDW